MVAIMGSMHIREAYKNIKKIITTTTTTTNLCTSVSRECCGSYVVNFFFNSFVNAPNAP